MLNVIMLSVVILNVIVQNVMRRLHSDAEKPPFS